MLINCRWLYNSVFCEDVERKNCFIVVESCEKAIKMYVQENGLLMSRKNLPKTIRLADLGKEPYNLGLFTSRHLQCPQINKPTKLNYRNKLQGV